MRTLALLFAMVAVTGCGTECDDGDEKCNGEVVLICRGKQWDKQEYCAAKGLRCNVGGFCGPLHACCQL